jgi:phosphate starvation-inducible membrane PsiE
METEGSSPHSQVPATCLYPLSLLGRNILLNTLISNTLSLGSSLNVNDQVSHPYKTTGKIIVLYIYSLDFWIAT